MTLEKHDGDNKHAKDLSDQIGLDYYQVKVDFDYYCKNIVRFASAHDEILASPSTIVLYALAEKASEHVKVVLGRDWRRRAFWRLLLAKHKPIPT